MYGGTLVPEDFRFCPKLSRFITHQKKIVNIDEPLKRFFDVFEEMKIKPGPILIRLPPGLKFDKSLDGKEVWVFFNNDFGGYAVKNAGRLIKIINNSI
jgi:uncharacterized protein YecE (DUF72 family)